MWRHVRADAAEDSRMCGAVMPKRQQRRLDLQRFETRRARLPAEKLGLRRVRNAAHRRFDPPAIGLAPELEKRKAPKLAKKQGVGSRSGDPEGKPSLRIEVEHEGVSQNAADGARADVV